MSETEKRKTEHIRICLEKDVEFEKGNGFECYDFFRHKALPEIDFEEIDISTKFLGKEFSAPLFVEAMTGGTKLAEKINKNLAKACEDLGIGMGVGSQRAALEDPELAYTYQVRDVAPNIFLAGNIGAVQLLEYDIDVIKKTVDMIDADALAIHLNPAQEAVQPEGDKNWKGVFEKIKDVCLHLKAPVIVKETGCGITGEVAKRLESFGVSAIDVAGAGGSSWIKIEVYRGSPWAKNLSEWGIPTAFCLESCIKAGVKVPVIASGGMRTGIDCAKALCMGASLVGMALPLLKPAMESSNAVKEKLETVIMELKTVMFLLGVKNLKELRKVRIKRC
ncbi:MAG: type 2 isopentenyl-diphosphate Delta-isomerase [Candidatus Aenigmatarchaeota archaeon]|nr:MAG: type 2 isopentenyl-diphosphate Delta-isomerase [Candidatus Aenigmarchaeota archaeon]